MKPDRHAEYRRVEELIADVREKSKRQVITARFKSTCAECTKPIEVGDTIAWRRGGAAVHSACWQGEIRS